MLALLLSAGGSLYGQQESVAAAGRVVRVAGTDTVPVSRMQVVLHRVGRDVQGPIDSAFTDRQGRFRFQFRPDTTALFLVSAGFRGIEYFSTPVQSSAPDTSLLLVVSDTSLTTPVVTESRHVVISRPGPAGTRSVLEIVMLLNRGERTRVGRDSVSPTWTTILPDGAANFEPGQSDVSPDAMVLRGDTLQVIAALSPGEKQLVYSYALPATERTVQFRAPDSVPVFNVLLEEFDAKAAGPGVALADTEEVEGRQFQRWQAALAPGGVISVEFPGVARQRLLLPALVGGLVLLLGLGAWRMWPRRATVAPAPLVEPSLVDRLAELDAKYRGREGAVAEPEWAAYQNERSRLKRELAAQLARRRGGA